MSETERERWDRRYAEGGYRPRAEPSPFLERWIDRLPPGRALDLACGTGRNALRLAEAGYEVEALDISGKAIDVARAAAELRGLEITWRVADLDHAELGTGRFDVITVFRYVNRALFPRIAAALAPGGHVVYEHHLRTPLPDVGGPSDPEHRLAPGELLRAFEGLRVLEYQETVVEDRSTMVLARLVACAGDPGC